MGCSAGHDAGAGEGDFRSGDDPVIAGPAMKARADFSYVVRDRCYNTGVRDGR